MPRGLAAKPGDTNVNKNGYQYTRTEDRGWVGTHILVMEKHLGRRLHPGEYVAFKDGHEPPITLDMLILRRKGDYRRSNKQRIAAIEAQIEELQAELQFLKEEASDEADYR